MSRRGAGTCVQPIIVRLSRVNIGRARRKEKGRERMIQIPSTPSSHPPGFDSLSTNPSLPLSSIPSKQHRKFTGSSFTLLVVILENVNTGPLVIRRPTTDELAGTFVHSQREREQGSIHPICNARLSTFSIWIILMGNPVCGQKPLFRY